MKFFITILFLQFCFLHDVNCQQNDPKDLAAQAINYFTGNAVKKNLSKAEQLADQAILYGSRDVEVFKVLKEVEKKKFELTKEAKKIIKNITIDPVKKPFDYYLILDAAIEKSTLPEVDKNNLILYSLLFYGQNRPHIGDYDMNYIFNQIDIFHSDDRGSLIGMMPFGEPGNSTFTDNCFTDIVCKAYLSSKKIYTLTEEDKAFSDIYSSLYNGTEKNVISREDLIKAKQKHEAFLQKYPGSKYVSISLQNVNRLLGNTITANEQPVDKVKAYFWEDIYYLNHKPARPAYKSKYPFWMKFDTIQSKMYDGLFITERNASYHDMFFNSTGEYLLVMDGPFFFNTYKAGKRLTDNERSIVNYQDFATVYNVALGYAAIRVPGNSRKMDSLLNLMDLNSDNFKKEVINVSVPIEKRKNYLANIEKECGAQEHIEFHGGLHNRADTIIFSTGGYYKDHIDIFIVDTKTGNLIRQLKFNSKVYGNLVSLSYQFSPDLSKMAIQSRFKYSNASEEPYHDAYTTVYWSAIEILNLEDDNSDIVALNDSKNQLAQTNFINWEHGQAEAKYNSIQENNRKATGTMADKLKAIDDMKRQWDNESAADRDKKEEQKWHVISCPTCNGTGKLMSSTCFRCNGAGQVKVKRQ